MDTAINAILEQIAHNMNVPGQKQVIVGFDGFIDTIEKPILKTGNENEQPEYFKTMEQFGAYISAQSHKSASIEMEVLDRRPGGNMPNFSRGIAALGIKPLCIGMLSGADGTIDPVFSALPGEKISYAPAGTAFALEFNDGKLFLAPRYTLDGSPWEHIEQSFSAHYGASGYLDCCLENADLIACLNWSELAFTDKLWHDLYQKCASLFCRDKQKYLLFDLCDFTRRTSGELKNIISLVKKFAGLRTAVLSLNIHEALLLEERILNKYRRGKDLSEDGMEELGSKIFTLADIDEIIIHSHHKSIAVTAEGVFGSMTTFCGSPAISTGAGDHFNAAYSFALLNKLSVKERLQFANFYAFTYITAGISQNIKGLREFNETGGKSRG
ncbi:MAG: hypothetical protein LBD18_04795 [Treponema sp.]|jgi:hypothetical protein|nr:hypothetical protein [Treponema sp.]